MSQDERRTGGWGDLPVTADLPGDPTRDRYPTTDRVVFEIRIGPGPGPITDHRDHPSEPGTPSD
ncbi:hypothetical protein OH809_06045 [Streptomyces sp. NBC_00873]|uniref:hypothetical protein n=1 Tax=Streptomyces sp. NBC_00873 TaxID=2975852 RepID=UPI00386B52E0|nr:hypothetical protein OH809_06045 [Streptomyces sp. NBC_00873]